MAERRLMKGAIRILEEVVGDGPCAQRRQVYRMRLKLWLSHGEPVRWQHPSGFIDTARLEDEGTTLIADLRYDRESLFPGLFRGIDGMCIGGTRKLKIAAHLGYGARGLPGIIPANAALVAEITLLGERAAPARAPVD